MTLLTVGDWQAGRIEPIEPTVGSLDLLSRYRTTDEALAATRAGAGAPGGRG